METVKSKDDISRVINPYSLGILTEWKPEENNPLEYFFYDISLLARDINWMETPTVKHNTYGFL